MNEIYSKWKSSPYSITGEKYVPFEWFLKIQLCMVERAEEKFVESDPRMVLSESDCEKIISKILKKFPGLRLPPYPWCGTGALRQVRIQIETAAKNLSLDRKRVDNLYADWRKGPSGEYGAPGYVPFEEWVKKQISQGKREKEGKNGKQ